MGNEATPAPVLEPGRYPNLPNDQYQAADAVSRSDIELIRSRTPAHLKAKKDDVAEDKQTPAMIEGDAVHAAILEPERFAAEYCEGLPEYRKNADKEWREAQRAAGIEPLNPNVYERAHRLRDAVHAHPAARQILRSGVAEESYFGHDPRTGELCKARPDFRMESGPPVDLKTADDAAPSPFGKKSFNYGYFIQPAFYIDVMRWAPEGPNLAGTDFLFIVVEKEPPYPVAVYYATEEMVEAGRRYYEAGLDEIAHCRAAGDWPAYSPKVEPLNLPGWANP